MRISVNEEPVENEVHIAELEIESTNVLADLHLICNDILEAGGSVKKFILKEHKLHNNFNIEKDSGLWKVIPTNGSLEFQNETLESYIWESALVKYSRCFSNSHGKRIRLDKNNVFHDQEKIDAHNFFVNLRNKHISHPVGILEKCKIGIELSPISSKDKQFLRFAALAYTRVLETNNTLNTFINLCDEILTHLEKMINSEYNKLKEWIDKQDIEELYKLPYLSLKIPNTNVTKERNPKQKNKT